MRRAVPIALALVVAAATAFVAFYTWELATIRHIMAAFLRHPPPRGAAVERALGMIQAVAGTAVVILGVLGRRSARRVYVAWLLALAAVVIADVMAGAYLDSVLVAAAYIVGAALAVGAGWGLTKRSVAGV